MYMDAVQSIQDHLIQRSLTSGLLYTSELIPERGYEGQLYVTLSRRRLITYECLALGV